VELARQGERGDIVITTSDGRVLVSQSSQVDVLAPVYAPSVLATNPPDLGVAAIPMPFLRVTFDTDMAVQDSAVTGSVLNPANYALIGSESGAVDIRSVSYDAETRTAILFLDALQAEDYTLTVSKQVSSV